MTIRWQQILLFVVILSYSRNVIELLELQSTPQLGLLKYYLGLLRRAFQLKFQLRLVLMKSLQKQVAKISGTHLHVDRFFETSAEVPTK